MKFHAAGPPDLKSETRDRIDIFFRKDEILSDSLGKPFFFSDTPDPIHSDVPPALFLGYAGDLPCFVGEWDDRIEIPPGVNFNPFRKLLPLLTKGELKLCFRARHLLGWASESRFCGRCGEPAIFHPKETARLCPSCGYIAYPRISPAVITMVTKEDKILLAHNIKFPGNIHSLIAGFVDPGESLEETVAREIREEVGLEVKNISYFASQPWPFPNSLMCAFTAEWKSGDIEPDKEEIDRADWFPRDNMPSIPGQGSVSRTLIDYFLLKGVSE